MGKITVDTATFVTQLEIAHKHIGNMLDELKCVCSSCGSTDTTTRKLYGDDEIKAEIKDCNQCEEQEVIRVMD